MESLDVQGLALCLRDHLDSSLISKLQEQGVDGHTFINLSAQNLIIFGFTLREVTDITRLIKDIEDNKVLVDLESAGRKGSNTHSETSSNSINNEFHDDEIDDRFKPLQEFVDIATLMECSDMEKVNMLAKLNNWRSLQKLGLPHTSKPDLGLCASSVNKTTHVRKANSKVASINQNKQKAIPSKQSTIPQNNKKQPDRSVKRKSSEAVTSSETDETNSDKPENDKELDASWDDNRNSECDSDSDTTSSDDLLRNKENFIKPTFSMLTKDELSAIHPDLPSFEVENILLADDKAKVLVPHLKEGFLLPAKLRKMMFRILVRHIINKQTLHVNKFTTNMKHGLAKSIVTTYIQYQSPVANVTPWAHIFNPIKNSGHLANIAKRAQTSLPLAERSRKGKKPKKLAKRKSRNDCEVNIETLAIMMPDREHREEIFNGMEKTFLLRCEDREKGLSITSLIEKYPQLLNFSGELISLEFKLQYPKAEDMCVAMTPLIPKVIQKWNDARVKPNCSDDTVKAFMILASRLPHAINRRMRHAFPQEQELIVVVNRGTDLESFVMDRRNEARTAVQPYLLAVRGLLTADILKLFLVLDGKLLELPKIPMLRAIDILFKCFTVFNVHYPQTWTQFFRFLQTCFYKFLCSEKDVIPPSSIELYSHVTAL